MVGVLVLVNENVAEFSLIEFPHVGVLLKQADRVEDNVVKIQCAGGPELFLISQIDIGDLLQPQVVSGPALLLESRSQKHLILSPGDVSQDRAGLEGFIIHVQFLQALLDDTDGIIRVVDGEGGGEPQLFDVPPENADAGGVEGSGPDILGLRADGCLQALL